MTEAGPEPQRTPSPTEAADATRSAAQQAKAMKITREQHATETAQDYLEAIADLIQQNGEARVVDLASRLGISHATVIQTVRRLQGSGHVTSEPYRAIFLTESGRKIAEEARYRHQLTVAVLKKLGVSTEAAEVDAEGIEHHLSQETLNAFERFVKEGT
jgi:DtxR family transcriptional regulator, manganese transport regulator